MGVLSFFSYKDIMNDSCKKSSEAKPLNQEELLSLQKCLLEIYSDIYNACEKYHIKPFLQGGTLLGYKRHNGFIPWDDDLDLGMCRKDYEKFKKIFEKSLGDKYILKAPGYKGGATNRFIQVYKKGTVFETVHSSENTMNMVSIDIFPIDYAPDNSFIRKIKGIYCNILMGITGCVSFREEMTDGIEKFMKRDRRGIINYTIRNFAGMVFSFRSLSDWYKKVDKAVACNRVTGYVTSATGRKHYLGEILKAEYILPLKKVDYYDMKAWIPENSDAYLRNLYGDNYMEIPPVEKRECHFIKKMVL